MRIESGEVELVATVRGAGVPTLLLHGEGFTRGSWGAVLDHLADEYHCVAPDQRGCGESNGDPDAGWTVLVDDVAAWVATCSSPPVLVGHSWGAKIALLAAARGVASRGVYCVDGAIWNQPGGALSEDVYDRIAVPISMLFGRRSKAYEGESWPFTPATIGEFAIRHPTISTDWTDTGHDILSESPVDLSRRIREFARTAAAGPT